MKQKTVSLPTVHFSNDLPLAIIAGINVMEGRDLAFSVATALKEMTSKLGLPFVFKASFDKANRSSFKSYRGIGMDETLKIFAEIKTQLGVPVITDIHDPAQAPDLAEVVDILQIPAFLCRQTDLVLAAAHTGKVIHVKKMQMMAPWDVTNIFKKFEEAGNTNVLICERGTTFGYNNLVVDPLGFPHLKDFGYPVIFDVTHSLQQPGGLGEATAGRGKLAEGLALAGVVQGIAGVFLETHPEPENARCDGPCATPLRDMPAMLSHLKEADQMVKGWKK
jgi:2-dehydro-3-deoxyphosphooctonate aldolase (KDO 8-P synthase)